VIFFVNTRDKGNYFHVPMETDKMVQREKAVIDEAAEEAVAQVTDYRIRTFFYKSKHSRGKTPANKFI